MNLLNEVDDVGYHIGGVKARVAKAQKVGHFIAGIRHHCKKEEMFSGHLRQEGRSTLASAVVIFFVLGGCQTPRR